MKPIKSLVTQEQLTELATRSNFRLGKAIAEQGKIIFDTFNTFNVLARVEFKNKQPRTVHMESTPKGLRWKCTCSNRKDLFCEHCVALGIFLQESKN